MNFLPEEIERYSEKYTTEEPELLAELNRYTYTNVLIPRMLAGHLQGRVLSMLSKMINPKVIVEVGTYTGYSALCWAEGLAEGGVVHTIEVNDELEDKIRSFLGRSEFANQIELHIGNAMDILSGFTEPIDLLYLDADKSNYPAYLNMMIDRIAPGGYVIADNVLWSGKVVQPVKSDDKDTQALIEYAEMVHSDDRLENVLLPIRDGLLIARKK